MCMDLHLLFIAHYKACVSYNVVHMVRVLDSWFIVFVISSGSYECNIQLKSNIKR